MQAHTAELMAERPGLFAQLEQLSRGMAALLSGLDLMLEVRYHPRVPLQ